MTMATRTTRHYLAQVHAVRKRRVNGYPTDNDKRLSEWAKKFHGRDNIKRPSFDAPIGEVK